MRFIEPLQKLFPKALDQILSHKRMPDPEEYYDETPVSRHSPYLLREDDTPTFQRPIEFRFREFKLGETSFKIWSHSLAKLEWLARQLRAQLEHYPDPSTADREHILCELMKTVGFSLTSPATPMQLGNIDFFSTNAGTLFICPTSHTPLHALREMIAVGPEMILFLDA